MWTSVIAAATQGKDTIELDPNLFTALVIFCLTGVVGLITWLFKQILSMGQIISKLEWRVAAHTAVLEKLVSKLYPEGSPIGDELNDGDVMRLFPDH